MPNKLLLMLWICVPVVAIAVVVPIRVLPVLFETVIATALILGLITVCAWLIEKEGEK